MDSGSRQYSRGLGRQKMGMGAKPAQVIIDQFTVVDQASQTSPVNGIPLRTRISYWRGLYPKLTCFNVAPLSFSNGFIKMRINAHLDNPMTRNWLAVSYTSMREFILINTIFFALILSASKRVSKIYYNCHV